MDCYPICLGRLVATLAVSLIVSFSSALPDKAAQALASSAMEVSDEKERWLQLKEEITYHDDLYYKKATPEISDAQYDALKREFIRLNNLFEGRDEADAVGDDRQGGFSQARHFAPMLSLEKAYSESELIGFHNRIVEAAGEAEIRYSIEPKIDGMAVSVLYENGEFVRAVTRGNGTVGEEISENVLSIDGFPRRLAGSSLPERVELRGEIFVTFEDFRKVNEGRIARGEEAFAHPRTLAAGSAKLSDPGAVKGRRLSIVFFGLGLFDPIEDAPSSQAQFYDLAAEWGLPILSERLEAEGENSLLSAVQAMQEERLSLPFATDGSVVKVDSFETQQKLGESREAPYWAIAYKATGALVETNLLGVTLQVGRSGALTPVAELEAVKISGSLIERASLHNFNEVEKLDLRIGDTVFLKKAGEIIPQVMGVNYAKRDPASRPFVRPKTCPTCGAGLTGSDSGAKVYCLADSCPERIKRRLEHFVSREAVNMEGWGAATLGALVDKGLVNDIAGIYELDRESFEKLDYVGAVTADRLLSARDSSRREDLWRFVYGLGIPGIGEVRAKRVARALTKLDDLQDFEDLQVGDWERMRMADYFANPSRRAEFSRLLSMDVCTQSYDTDDLGNSKLFGKTFAFTGKLESMTRSEAMDQLQEKGALAFQSLTAECDYLVVGSSPGSKLSDAKRRGIEILNEAQFIELLNP
ncbi:NAD-dependent DNA ligase LigA [Pelagicoccus sp. SDUM812002]|uniref:NAD-dependent DNA ligase LigA n=1 Tax=Pelagicoccus sp. SDUM812002 TaxID=3041266 RepID=UPI00280C4691|nr:NAD-dependent DNA ligase LigA [Pelagicoccus sp. SDUM812002]MDQ8186138.1 NAD-dependent DNA ligase LigA [Pelagicoccus sp. SDUM812002]